MECQIDYFFVTEESGEANLIQEGKSKNRIHFVGNVMIDNLFYQVEKLNGDMAKKFTTLKIKEKLKDYAFLTLHRPSNVDIKSGFNNRLSIRFFCSFFEIENQNLTS